MRISPLVLLLFATIGCGSELEPAKQSAEPGVNQARRQNVATPEKQVATSKEQASAPKTPDVAAVKKQMTPAQLELGDPVVNSIGMVLVPIPAGEFQMGSQDSDRAADDDEKPQHVVKITKTFYLSVYKVTQEQYEKLMGVRPWHGKKYVQDGPDYPATQVRWNDAVELCRKLSEREGVEYRLPTEAQWEYACRAGTTTTCSFGNHSSNLGQHAWYFENAWDIGEKYAHRVGQKLPNPWGLYDMHGNAWEWCQDWYSDSFYISDKVFIDPSGPASGDGRIMRGGSFYGDAAVCRSAYRNLRQPDDRLSLIGFRVARAYPLIPFTHPPIQRHETLAAWTRRCYPTVCN